MPDPRCHRCDRVKATAADWSAPGHSDEGHAAECEWCRARCWDSTTCTPVDWRGRALRAEAKLAEYEAARGDGCPDTAKAVARRAVCDLGLQRHKRAEAIEDRVHTAVYGYGLAVTRSLEAERDRLKTLLRAVEQNGSHRWDCRLLAPLAAGNVHCTCGWTDLQRQVSEATRG